MHSFQGIYDRRQSVHFEVMDSFKQEQVIDM